MATRAGRRLRLIRPVILWSGRTRDHLPPKNGDHLFGGTGYPKRPLFTDSLPEPVIKAKILIDQISSHLLTFKYLGPAFFILNDTLIS